MSTKSYEGWVVVFESGTDYESDLVRNRLDDAGIPAVVLTQRDHAFNLTVGYLAQVHVLVPPEQAEEAAALLASPPATGAALDEAALAATASSEEDAGTLADSGIEEIHLSIPEDDEDASND